MTPTGRAYETTHPWITFKPPADVPAITWAHLGESYSKCQHLVGTPLQPGIALHLSEIYLRRGALASAAIEGNTLNEEQAEDILVRNRKLPESQSYLEQELRNVVNALEEVRGEVSAHPFRLTPEWIRAKHAVLMEDLELEDHVVPGEFRTVAVGVGNYRGPAAEDVEYLMATMCDWVNQMIDEAAEAPSEDVRFFTSFFAATLAHLYLAWIHPFGDGNGRSARLIETAVLANSKVVPWVSTNVLSNFYNKTKSRYYLRLESASKRREVAEFVAYSAIGFRDELREQIADVQRQQRRVAWINYVHERFQDEPSTETLRRRRAVALEMPPGMLLGKRQIRELTPAIARMYAGSSDRLFNRDMTKLLELNLIRAHRAKYESNIDVMDAFVPKPEAGIYLPILLREGPEAA